jgi:predicted MFS family arabinose efflux permease
MTPNADLQELTTIQRAITHGCTRALVRTRGDRTAPERWLLWTLALATFVSLLHYLAFSPLLPAMALDLGLGVGLLGQVPAAIGLGAALLGPIVGLLADRHGHRPALLAGLVTLVASSTAMALVSTPAVLPLVALLGAAGRATVHPVALAVASTRFDGDARRAAVGRITTSLSVAPVLGIPILAAAATALGWRAAFLVAAALTVTLLVTTRAVLDGAPCAPPPGTVHPSDLVAAYRPLVRHRPSLGLIGATFLLSAGGWTVWTYLGAFVVQRHGFTTEQAGWAWAAVGLGFLAGGLLAGGRLGRRPLRPLFIAAGAGAGLCLGAGLLLPLAWWAAVGSLALGTLLYGITQVASALLLAQETPVGQAATMTLRGSATSLGAALGGAAGGAVLPVAGFEALGLGAAVYCLVGAALAWWWRGVQRTAALPDS